MKHILLLSVLFATFLSADTQIVIGTFSKEKSANNIREELNNIIKKDIKLNKFLKKNNIDAIAKEDGKYFIVTLEPIKNKKVQQNLLKKIKKTRFKDAYVLKLSTELQTQTEVKQTIEPKKAVVIEEITPVDVTPVEIKKVKETDKSQKTEDETKLKEIQKTFEQTPIVQENFVQTYMNEIIAFISILILIVAYIFIVRHKKEQENLVVNEDEIIIEDKFDTIVQDELKEQEELVQEKQSQEIGEISYPRSDVIKKEVPPHDKISKENFKEFSGKKLMIAEDNLINQKVINGLLAESGILLTTVDDGKEVLNQLEKDDDFSIILMDVHMPNMDGFEATKIIRSNPKYSHVTVVALSGDIAPDDIENMRKAGMQENLEKPLKMDSLYDILYAYLEDKEPKVQEDDIPQIKELNTEVGLEVCANDNEFYKEILRDFLNNYEDSSREIQEYLNSEDFDQAEKLLLDIIGVTANIGANNVQELLKDLKQEIHNPENKDYEDTFMNYASHFEALKTEIQEYIS